jgi:MoxR-like ATPase
MHSLRLAPQEATAAASLSADSAPASMQAFRDDFARVRGQIERAVVGQSDIVEGLLISMFAGGHVLLEGVPGIGKTLLVRTLSQALSLSFSRVQFTPDLMPADITGTTVVNEVESPQGKQRVFAFQRGPIFGQIVLADEINRATPKTQSALLEAMQERSVTVAGTTHALPSPFLVMATQNPVEQEGTYPLPEAQLDRFFFKLLSLPPSRSELAMILQRTTTASAPVVQPVLDAASILRHQQLIRQVVIAPHVEDYIVRIVLATQPTSTLGAARASDSFATPMVNQYVRLGSSPRGAQTITLASKCVALLAGRASVAIEDVKKVALPALRHRLILNFESHAQGIATDEIVRNLLDTLPVNA